MMIAPLSPGSMTAAPTQKTGWSALGQADFIRLLTVQMQQQDPFDPVDNTQMLAQMAQFSSLASSNDISATLQQISAKLDALTAGQSTQEN